MQRCPSHPRRQPGCPHCRARMARYKRIRAHAVAAGRWAPMVPVDQVRTHLRNLLNAGMRLVDIAEHAGMARGQVSEIMYLRSRRHVTPTTAELLLSITARPATRWLIDATGTHRRLQALATIGWPQHTIAEHAGRAHSAPDRWLRSPHVTRATAARVTAVYNTLSDTPGPSAVVARRARSQGWLTPNEWVGFDIDNPDDGPTVDPDHIDPVAVTRALRGDTTVQLTDAEKDAAVRLGLADGITAATLSRRLHVGDSRIKRILTTVAS